MKKARLCASLFSTWIEYGRFAELTPIFAKFLMLILKVVTNYFPFCLLTSFPQGHRQAISETMQTEGRRGEDQPSDSGTKGLRD